jgi:FkbM family methyltransferase
MAKMSDEGIAASNEQLRHRLASLTGVSSRAKSVIARSAPFDLIVTHNEVNQRHGTGSLLLNIFAEDSRVVSLRARNDYHGEHGFGAFSLCLPHGSLTRPETFQYVSTRLSDFSINRILAVPISADSVLTAIAAKEIYGAPMCTYIMDDANVHALMTSDELMAELLDKSDLRLAISSEMRIAYEEKYRRKFWVLPPIVSAKLIATNCNLPPKTGNEPARGVMIGNIWGQQWLRQLVQVVEEAKVEIDWYHNAGASTWVHFSEHEFARAGVSVCKPLPEPMLASVLRRYSFALVPSGTLDLEDDNSALALLSLPSKIPFISATSNVPIIVMGDPDTAAARFVRRVQIGVVCDYTASGLLEAVRMVTEPERSAALRRKAFELSPHFSSELVDDWIWKSLQRGEPCDERFEVFMQSEVQPSVYVEKDPPKGVRRDCGEIYKALGRLKRVGFQPDFVVDVGASNGLWSHFAHVLFPNSRFILVEPLASIYRNESDFFFSNNPEFEIVESAVSDRAGTATLHVSANPRISSFFPTAVSSAANGRRAVEVKIVSLDQLAQEKNIIGRGLVKIDVQYAEHLVLAGAQRLLEQVDAIVVELSLVHVPPGAKGFLEMVELLDSLGFNYFDDAGEWRLAANGLLAQKDVVFVRKDLDPVRKALTLVAG